MSKKSKFRLSTLLAGAALGAGWAALRARRARLEPERTPAQRRINRALDRTLLEARLQGEIPLAPQARYVIFSDHHKGARNRADDFQQCEQTYLQALDYYYEQGYSLVLLGDAEELWEEDIPDVMSAYENVFISEARFHPGRLFKIVGNHDNLWEDGELVAQYLHPFFPGMVILHGLLFSYQDDPRTSGKLFLVHGHQGTMDADLLDFLPPLVLPLYRDFQNLTGLGRTTPAQDDCLRAEHDTQMYRWSSRQGKLLLIAGHTHRPVWSSLTHLEKLTWKLHALLRLPEGERPEDFDAQVDSLLDEIQVRQMEHPPCIDTLKIRPTYFNSGCCRFEDGDITGIELLDGRIRLVRWSTQDKHPGRTVFESVRLTEIFALL